MASSCELSKLAYSKIILHALKYPHVAINGVLLAPEGPNNHSVKYVDAIPLFHHNLGLAPMLEVALMQIDSYCRTAGLVIAGYYQGSDLLGDASPDLISQKIMEKIAEYYPTACLVLINNSQLSREMNKPAISVMQYLPDGRWKSKEKENLKLLPSSDAALSTVSTLISRKVYRDIVDFDDHLDDISLDWLNVALKPIIE